MRKKSLLLIIASLVITCLSCVFAFSAGALDTELPSVSIDKFNLVFEDNVYLKYGVKFSGINEDKITSSSIGMLHFTAPQESYTAGNEAYSSKVVGYTHIDSEKYYTFEYRHISAKQMTDYIYSVAYIDVDAKRYYSAPVKYSVLDYAYSRLGKTAEASENEDFRNMLSSMLEYGANAQTYFDYKTERLANEDYYLVSVIGGALEDGFTKGLYKNGEVAILTAPSEKDGFTFDSWQSSSGAIVSKEPTVTVSSFSQNETYTAVYTSSVLNTIADAELPHYSYASHEENVFNDELFYKNSYQIPLGDPSVFAREENGVTWFYVTGTSASVGFEMWKTKNFTDWESLGNIYSPEENFFGKSSFWAPQLFYDENADWKYYLGDSSESGKGLYLLFFSARRESNACALSVAFSKNIEGPYKSFVGIDANGDYVDESNSCFEIEKLKGLGLYADHVYGDLYKKNRSFIDASPFVDPKTGEKYLYMVRNRNVDSSNDVWGVKMKDWVTPDYQTATPLTSYGYTDINKTEPYGYKSASNIDEGPFLYYKDCSDDGVDNGKYYLTFSIGDTNDKLYPVCQAIGDSPLGPFTKIQPENGGFVGIPEQSWDIHGCGHHAFFEVNGELYIAYHTYQIGTENTILKRYFAFDRIEWVYNDDGQYLMRSNGPSKSLQPLPSAASGYTNVAKKSSPSVKGTNVTGSAASLNNGLIALREGDENMLLSFSGDAEITLTFEEYVSARAILIYNSYDVSTAFSEIDKIEFSYRKEIDGKIYFGVAVINGLKFNFSNNLIPEAYLKAKGESNLSQLRPASSAIAEFNEIEINSVKIYLSNADGAKKTSISEIVILGKDAESNITDESKGYGGYTHEPGFEPYTSFGGAYLENMVSIDGVLDEDMWRELATVITIEGADIDNETKEPVDIALYGEREAKLYTYIGEEYVYFAFDVKDKNLYFNSSQPQGRSTCVEIYFTSSGNTEFADGCYSIRINPIGNSGLLSYNLGVYIPNDEGNEWKSLGIIPTIYASVKVHGSVQTAKSSEGYDTSENVGYTVEFAFDKALIGLDADSFRFTAAFVQDRGYDEPRIANSFIPNTSYVKPKTWILFSNKNNEN